MEKEIIADRLDKLPPHIFKTLDQRLVDMECGWDHVKQCKYSSIHDDYLFSIRKSSMFRKFWLPVGGEQRRKNKKSH